MPDLLRQGRDVSMHDAVVGRTQLAWREAGTGRPVLLIHCFPVDGRLFDEQLTAAATGRLGARVIAPDLPGFGRSPFDPDSEAAGTTDLAEVLLGLVGHLELRDPVLGGVAVGGTIAGELAARLGTATALVLVGNRAGGAPVGPAGAREHIAGEALRAGSASVAARLAASALGPDASPDVRRRVEAMIGGADPRGIVALAGAISRRPDVAALVPPLGLPTLVIGGLEDRISPIGGVRQLAAQLPNATLVEVAGAGHMVPIEEPDAMTDALAAFLARLGGNPQG